MKMQQQRTTDVQDDLIDWPVRYTFRDVEHAGQTAYLRGHADGMRDGRTQLIDELRAEALHEQAARSTRAASDAIDLAEQRQRESEGLARARQRWERPTPIVGGGDAA